jgi:hypothetical protein
MSPNQLSLELRRIATMLDEAKSPSRTVVHNQLTFLVKRIASIEPFSTATITMSITGSSDRDGEEAERGDITIRRYDGREIVATWVAEGGVGGGLEIVKHDNLTFEQAQQIMDVLHDWLM